MSCYTLKMKKEFLIYLKCNKIVNLLFVFSLCIIVICQIAENKPVWANLSADAVNFYLNIFLNLAIGYIVSTLFYILVVYYPERQKKKIIKAKTAILFARMQTLLSTSVDLFIESVNIEIDATDGVPDEYQKFIDAKDTIELMRQYEISDPWGTRSALE